MLLILIIKCKERHCHCTNQAVGKKRLKSHNCCFYAVRHCYFAENNEMDEQTKKNIYKILEQAKVLEELMKEVELPLNSTKHSALSMNPHRCPLINLLKPTPQEHFHQDSWPRKKYDQ